MEESHEFTYVIHNNMIDSHRHKVSSTTEAREFTDIQVAADLDRKLQEAKVVQVRSEEPGRRGLLSIAIIDNECDGNGLVGVILHEYRRSRFDYDRPYIGNTSQDGLIASGYKSPRSIGKLLETGQWVRPDGSALTWSDLTGHILVRTPLETFVPAPAHVATPTKDSARAIAALASNKARAGETRPLGASREERAEFARLYLHANPDVPMGGGSHDSLCEAVRRRFGVGMSGKKMAEIFDIVEDERKRGVKVARSKTTQKEVLVVDRTDMPADASSFSSDASLSSMRRVTVAPYGDLMLRLGESVAREATLRGDIQALREKSDAAENALHEAQDATQKILAELDGVRRPSVESREVHAS